MDLIAILSLLLNVPITGMVININIFIIVTGIYSISIAQLLGIIADIVEIFVGILAIIGFFNKKRTNKSKQIHKN